MILAPRRRVLVEHEFKLGSPSEPQSSTEPKNDEVSSRI